MSDHRRGRKPVWTPDRKAAAIERVCDRIAGGESLRTICADPWMPNRWTVLEWVRSEPEFGRRYALAMEMRADVRSDRMDGYVRDMLAGKISPEAARVMIDAEKWQASKECPRRYGRHVTIEQRPAERMTDEQIDARINQLLGKVARTGAITQPVRTGARARVMGYYNG